MRTVVLRPEPIERPSSTAAATAPAAPTNAQIGTASTAHAAGA